MQPFGSKPFTIKEWFSSITKKPKQPNQKIGRTPKQTFLQRRHTESQQAHEKMLNITNYHRNLNQNYNEVSPHTSQNDHHQKNLQTINAGEDVEKKELSHCWWDCKLIQPLWRTIIVEISLKTRNKTTT